LLGWGCCGAKVYITGRTGQKLDRVVNLYDNVENEISGKIIAWLDIPALFIRIER
jgi:hypothetical protein